MFQRRQRRFRRRSNGRNSHHSKDGPQNRLRAGTYSNSNGFSRNNFKNSLSAEKLFEKYTSLAKEAMSSGDKTLSENYLQHADHFVRIIEEKKADQLLNKSQVNVLTKSSETYPAQNKEDSPNQNVEEKK